MTYKCVKNFTYDLLVLVKDKTYKSQSAIEEKHYDFCYRLGVLKKVEDVKLSKNKNTSKN